MGLTAKLVLKTLETGLVPERLTRTWVRYLCSQAIDRASLGDVEARHAVFRQINKELKMGASLRRDERQLVTSKWVGGFRAFPRQTPEFRLLLFSDRRRRP